MNQNDIAWMTWYWCYVVKLLWLSQTIGTSDFVLNRSSTRISFHRSILPTKTYPKKPYHIRCFPIIMIKILKCSQNNISFLQYWLILWVNWNSTMQKLSAEMRSLICGVELSMCQNSLGRVLFSRIFLHCFIWNTVVSLNWEAFLLFCSSNLFQCTTNFDEC